MRIKNIYFNKFINLLFDDILIDQSSNLLAWNLLIRFSKLKLYYNLGYLHNVNLQLKSPISSDRWVNLIFLGFWPKNKIN